MQCIKNVLLSGENVFRGVKLMSVMSHTNTVVATNKLSVTL